MRGISTTIIFLLLSMSCAAQKKECANLVSIGAGLLPTPSYVQFGIDRMVSAHWTAGGRAWINLSRVLIPDKEEETHKEEFADEDSIGTGEDCDFFSLAARYWLTEAYEGTYLTLGLRSDMKRTQGIVGAGYMMRIYKGIHVMVSYEKVLDNDKDSMTAGLCINF